MYLKLDISIPLASTEYFPDVSKFIILITVVSLILEFFTIYFANLKYAVFCEKAT
jgi:hypothetical protein